MQRREQFVDALRISDLAGLPGFMHFRHKLRCNIRSNRDTADPALGEEAHLSDVFTRQLAEVLATGQPLFGRTADCRRGVLNPDDVFQLAQRAMVSVVMSITERPGML